MTNAARKISAMLVACCAALGGAGWCAGAVAANPGMFEQTEALGIVNGQVNAHRQVEIIRPLPDPILVRASKQELGDLPTKLVLRQAQGWAEEQGVVRIEQRHPLSTTLAGTPQQANLTLKVRVEADGKPALLGLQAQGEDVVLLLPSANELLVLRSDQPMSVQLPSGYRGTLSLPLIFEGWGHP